MIFFLYLTLTPVFFLYKIYYIFYHPYIFPLLNQLIDVAQYKW